MIPSNVVDDLIRALQPRARGAVYEAVAKVVKDVIADGWSGTQVVTQVSLIFHLSRCVSGLTRAFLALSTDNVQRCYAKQVQEQNCLDLLGS